MKTGVGENVHLPLKEFLEILTESDKIEERPILVQFDEEIHVARRASVASGDRPEDPQVPGFL